MNSFFFVSEETKTEETKKIADDNFQNSILQIHTLWNRKFEDVKQ